MAKEEKKKNSKAQEETVEATETETKAEEATEEKEPTAEEKLTEELKKEKEKYMRLAAEYDNYRKRTQQEKLGIYDDATAKAWENARNELLDKAGQLVGASGEIRYKAEDIRKALKEKSCKELKED